MSPSANCTPMLAWSTAQLARVGLAIERALAGWSRDWVPRDAGESTVECTPMAGVASSAVSWRSCGRAGHPLVWIGMPHGAAEALQALLFGEVGTTPVAQAVTQRALRALDASIAQRFALDASTDGCAPPEFDAWSGAVLVTWQGVPGLELVLTGPAVATLVASPDGVHAKLQPLHDVAAALARTPLKLAVELASCELSLGALAGLRIGDIVTFPHGLDEPLLVTAADAPVCQAWLGRRHGKRAVELTRIDALPEMKAA